MSLLDEAINTGRKRIVHEPITDDDMELALAWLSNEIGITQVMKVKNEQTGTSHSYSFLLVCLREAYLQEKLKIK